MPIYEYSCRDCGKAFEVLQSIGGNGDDLRCPGCGAVGAERQLSTFAGHTSQAGSVGSVAATSPGCGAGGFT